MATERDKVSIAIEVKKIGAGLEEVKREIKELSGQVKTEGAKIRAQTSHMEQGFKGLSTGISRVRNLLIGLGAIAFAKKIGGQFLEVAKYGEKLRLTLNAALGSVKEGGKLFEDLGKFAAQIPFELREVMGAATQLSAIMKGGRTGIMEWMPLIADLAAYTQLGIELVTSQVMRMLSAGAAAADTFRDRGVSAMLGFTTGVQYSVEETKKRLWNAWAEQGSKFRGLTTEMAKGWDGMVSMLRDAWFQFRDKVMAAGLFDAMKNGLRTVLSLIDRFKKEGKLDEWAKKVSDTILTIFEKTIIGVAKIVDTVRPKVVVLWDYTKQMWESFRSLPDWLQEIGILGALMWGKKGALMSAGLAGWLSTIKQINAAYLVQQRMIVNEMETTVWTVEQQTAALEELKNKWVEVSAQEGFDSEKLKKLNEEIATYNERIAGLRKHYDELKAKLAGFDRELAKTNEDLKGLPPLTDVDPEGKATKAALKLIEIIRQTREEIGKIGEKPSAPVPIRGGATAEMSERAVAERIAAIRKELRERVEKEQRELLETEIRLGKDLVNSEHLTAEEREAIWAEYRDARIKQINEEIEAMELAGVSSEIIVAYQKDALAELENAHKKTVSEIGNVWEDLRGNLQWSLEAGLFDVFKGGFKDVGDAFRQFCDMLYESFARTVAKMITEWMLFGEVTGKGTGTGGIIGIVRGIVNAFQFGGLITEPVRGVGLRSGTGYLFGEAGPEAVVPTRGLLSTPREQTQNIYIVDERSKAQGLGPNDVVLVISDDIAKDGVVRKTIKRFI